MGLREVAGGVGLLRVSSRGGTPPTPPPLLSPPESVHPSLDPGALCLASGAHAWRLEPLPGPAFPCRREVAVLLWNLGVLPAKQLPSASRGWEGTAHSPALQLSPTDPVPACQGSTEAAGSEHGSPWSLTRPGTHT